jgi:hypothetical protein
MNLRRTLLIIAAACVVALGSISLGLPGLADASTRGEQTQTAAACGRCGDRQCVKSCGETATSCPIDCGVPSDNRSSTTGNQTP